MCPAASSFSQQKRLLYLGRRGWMRRLQRCIFAVGFFLCVCLFWWGRVQSFECSGD